MRRALVLTNESARHPFRASLPPHIRKFAPLRNNWRMSQRDWRYFAATYCVGFVAVTAFIA